LVLEVEGVPFGTSRMLDLVRDATRRGPLALRELEYGGPLALRVVAAL